MNAYILNSMKSEAISIPFLRYLAEKDQANALREMKIKHYKDSETVFSRKDPTTDVYFILEGAVKAVTYDVNGKMVYFVFRKMGDFFGFYSAITGEHRTADMVAVGNLKTAVMSGESFMKMVTNNPSMSRELLIKVTQVLRSETTKIINLLTLDSQQRVAADILNLFHGEKFNVIETPNREEWASKLGMSRETLSRHLSVLQKRKIIKIAFKKVEILDWDALIHLTEF